MPHSINNFIASYVRNIRALENSELIYLPEYLGPPPGVLSARGKLHSQSRGGCMHRIPMFRLVQQQSTLILLDFE